MFFKKGVLRSFTKFTGKQCQRPWLKRFPVNFAKCLPLFIEHLWWLLLIFFFFSRNTSGGWFYSCFLQNAISELTCCFFHSVYIAVFFFESKDCYNDYQEVFKVRFIEKVFIHLIALKPLR